MHLELNLATHPFGQRRLFWVSAGTAGVLLLAVAVALVALYARNREPAPQFVRQEAELRSQVLALRAEEADLKRKFAEPANERVLERSLFLNELLYRKGISWTKTFADLELICPPRVRMEQLRPQVTSENDVLLEMTVGAETRPDFIELLKVLEESDIFGTPDVRGSSPPTEQDPVFKYRLLVRYEQQL